MKAFGTGEYKFGDRLQSLLEVAGAELSIERFCSSSQDTEYGERNHVVCVIPRGSVDTFNKLSSLSTVNEVDLICAALSGHMDPSILTSPSVIISSSCSMDETVVADSDVEAETATSVHATAAVLGEESLKCSTKEEISINLAANKPEGSSTISFRDKSDSTTASRVKAEESEHNSDTILLWKGMSPGPLVPDMLLPGWRIITTRMIGVYELLCYSFCCPSLLSVISVGG